MRSETMEWAQILPDRRCLRDRTSRRLILPSAPRARMAGTVAGSERFDVRSAIETIDRAASYDTPLRRRTEGTTWMVWGLVGAMAYLLDEPLPSLPWQVVLAILTIGWPVLGVLATSAVWRIAALSRPALGPQAKRLTAYAALGSAAIAILFMAAWITFELSGSYVLTAAALAGLPWAFLTLVQWSRMSDEGRRLAVAIGIGMVTLLFAFVVALGADVPTLVPPTIIGGVPFAFGAWHAMRGGA